MASALERLRKLPASTFMQLHEATSIAVPSAPVAAWAATFCPVHLQQG